MNSLRWRLSFNQTKASRPLKLIWQEYSNGYLLQESVWTIQKRKALITFLDIIEASIDNGSLSNWVQEFDRSGMEIIYHFASSAACASKEDFSGSVEESALTTSELINRLLFVANHGLTSYVANASFVFEELERDQSILRNALALLQSGTIYDGNTVLELVRILRSCVGTTALAKLFVQQNGCNIIVDTVLRHNCSASCVHIVVSLLSTVVGNTRYAELVVGANQGSHNSSSSYLNNSSGHAFTRGRASSNSSLNSNLGSRGVSRRPQQDIQWADHSANAASANGGAFHPPTFAHLDGAESYQVESGDGAWGLFAEMIRLTPFGSTLWSPAADSRALDPIGEKGIAAAQHMGGVGDDLNIAPGLHILPELSVDDIVAEKIRIDEYTASSFEPSPFQRVRIYLFNNNDPTSTTAHLSPGSNSTNANVGIVIEAGKRFLLSAAEQSITPHEATNVIILLSLCVINGHENKALLMTDEIIGSIVAMLVRVDEGLELLGSCRDKSRAMALGGADQDRMSSSKRSTSSASDIDDSMKFHAHVAALMVKLTFDSVCLALRDDDTLLLGDMVVVWSVLQWVRKLLISGRSKLQTIALKYLLSVQHMCPLIAVAIEKSEVQKNVLDFFLSTLKRMPETETEFEAVNWSNVCLALLVLQRQATALHVDSQEICAALTYLLLRMWCPVFTETEVMRASRCSNCESEVAKYECIGESCIRENCNMLCTECDKVFHKSSSKRAHIRLVTLKCYHNISKNIPSSVGSESVLYQICKDLNSVMDCGLVDSCDKVVYSRSPTSSFFLMRELVSACICTSLGTIFTESLKWEARPSITPYILTSLVLLRRIAALPMVGISLSLELEAMVSVAIEDCRLIFGSSLFSSVPVPSNLTTPPPMPLSKWHRSPRRILHSTLVRLVSSAFFLQGSTTNPVFDPTEYLRLYSTLHGLRPVNHYGLFRDSSTSAFALNLVFSWQIDAVLIHDFCVDSINHNHLGLSERQANLWLLREWYQLSAVLGVQSYSLAKWILWCLHGSTSPVVHSIVKCPKPNSSSSVDVLLPLGHPNLNKMQTLVLLQELCVLFGGFGYTSNLADPGTAARLEMLCLESESRSRIPSKESTNQYLNSKNNQNSLNICFSVPHCHNRLKEDFFTVTEFVELLLILCFGDLVDMVGNLPVAALEKAILKFVRGVVGSPEQDQESFCLCLQLLGEVIFLFPISRDFIDQLLGARTFITMMQGLSEAFELVSSSEHIVHLLMKMALHHCLRGSLCFHPVLAFDRCMTGFSRVHNDGLMAPPRVSSRSFESQQPQQHALLATSSSMEIGNKKELFSSLLPLAFYHSHEIQTLSNMLSGVPVMPHLNDQVLVADLQMFLPVLDFHMLTHSDKRVDSLGFRSNRQLNRLNTVDDGMEETDSSRHILPRRSSRRLITSMSVASFDTGDPARWEIESVGRSSAAYGDLVSRGSMGSNQSVVAIMQALKAMPMEMIMQLPDCDERRTDTPGSPSKTSASLTHENLASRLAGTSTAQKQQTVLDEQQVDHVSDLMVSLSRQIYSVAPIMGVLHLCLVQRAGLSNWLDDIEQESASDINPPSLHLSHNSPVEETYYLLLKRHFGAFFLTKQEHLSPLRGDYPNWSLLDCRDSDCMENLLALTILFGKDLHQRALEKMLQSNPRCLFALSGSASLLLVLHRITTEFPKLSGCILKFLQLGLAYSVDTVLLRYLLHSARLDENSQSMQTFDLMYQVLQDRSPRSFLQFRCVSYLPQRILKLPPIGLPATPKKRFCCSLWIKFDWLEYGTTGAVLNCKLGDTLFFHLFIRTLYGTDAKGSTPRRYQLCLRLGKPAVDTSSWQTAAYSEETSLVLASASDALVGSFFPDFVSELGLLEDLSWKLLQISYASSKLSVYIDGVPSSMLRFTPQGYMHSDSPSESEAEFYSAIEAQLVRNILNFSLGCDPFSPTINSTRGSLDVKKWPAEVEELVNAYNKVSRCMGMRIAEVLVTDDLPSKDILNTWLLAGPYGGFDMTTSQQSSGFSILFSLSHSDLSYFANQHVLTRPHQVLVAAIEALDGAPLGNHQGRGSAGRTSQGELPLQQELSMSCEVLIHVCQHLLSALRCIGGMRSLLSLLFTGDASKTVATVRLLQHCVQCDSNYEDFRSEKLDSAILYAFSLFKPGDATEVLPVLCEWARIPIDSSPLSNLVRDDIIGWTCNVLCVLQGNLTVALQWTKWIRESILNEPDRRHLIAKQLSAFQLLSVGCLWIFDDWIIEQPQKADTMVVDTTEDEKGRSVFKTTGQQPLRYEKRTFRPSGPNLGVNMLDTVCNACLLQTQAFRILRLGILQQMTSKGLTPAKTNNNNKLTVLITNLLMTAVFCCRKAANASLASEHDRRTERDNMRKMERLKAKLRSIVSTVVLLRTGDCFSSGYWHASSALHILRLVEETLLQDLSLVRTIGHAFLSQVATELMTMSVPEVRAMAISLLTLSIATPDAQIDPKRLADLEKMHFFELFGEQLAAPRDPCDEIVLESLHNLLFWRLAVDADSRTAYYTYNNSGTHSGNHGSNTTQQGISEIVVPQCISALLRLLHHCRHWDVLRVNLLSLVDFSQGSKCAHTLDSCSERNLEKVLQRRDWVPEIADLIYAHQRKWQEQTNDDDSVGLFSLSESESVSGVSVGSGGQRGFDYMSGGESDDSSVATSDERIGADNSPESGQNSMPLDHASLRADFIGRFTEPVKKFFVFLITCDLMKKPGSMRKWGDLFRLALPETSRLLEELLLLVIRDIETVAVVQQDCEASVYYLANLTVFLEHLLEKAQVSLTFCVQTVGALQTLNYRCCHELRQRATKDTQMREARNNLLLRCLTETSQELPLRVSAALDVSAAIQAYVLQPEYKSLSDSAVCVLLMGMFLEVFEDLEEALFTTSASSSSSYHGGDLMGQLLRASLDGMVLLVDLVKTLILASSEAQRTLGRLFDTLICDEDKHCAHFFLPQKVAITSSINSTAASTSLSTGSFSYSSYGREARSSFGNGRELLSTAAAAAGNSCQAAAVQSNTVSNTSVSSNTSQGSTNNSWWLGWSLGTSTTASSTTNTNSKLTTSYLLNSENVGKDDVENYDSKVSETSTEVTSSGDPNDFTRNMIARNTIGGTTHSDVSVTSSSTCASTIRQNDCTTTTMDARSFVLWFCHADRRDLQVELRQKLGKELRVAVRAAEKLRERTAARLVRHIRSLQDKRGRERLIQAKQVSDGLQLTRLALDKAQSGYLRDLQAWQRSLRERLQQGREVFRHIVETKPNSAAFFPFLKDKQQLHSHRDVFNNSASMVSNSASLTLTTQIASPTANSNNNSNNYIVKSAEEERVMAMQSFRVPKALIEFLHEDYKTTFMKNNTSDVHSSNIVGNKSLYNNPNNSYNSNKKFGVVESGSTMMIDQDNLLRPTEALHALLECFASARRILQD